MARPNKQGVDYFPLDIHLDDKFKFIEIKYKLEGFAIVIKLMQRIYNQGYWCKWTEDEQLLFADEIKADYSLVENVVNECLSRGVFDNQMFDEHNILTSKGIQKRYKEIVRRRKDVEVTTDYLLIDGNFGVNDDIKTTQRKRNDVKSTQSKVKESKVKESKQKVEYKGQKTADNDAIVFYQNNIGTLPPAITEQLLDFINDFGDEMVIAALNKSLDQGKANWGYAKSILNDWSKKNITTLDQVKAEEVRFQNQKKQSYGNYQKSEAKPEWFNKRGSNITKEKEEAPQSDVQERLKKYLEGS
ncbi:Lin1244/Lin1753 domain-containing protein [Oceanobacillus kimchii]|uniref:Lin1244/Lin1753 domain-containing protein n=1 Tax=Oceanobacillus kimchii TaxID=746691 RepID=UPI00232B5D25|nr:Lin1244/Lin1753 domain-containing protein [Oceanobacillus kimchii]